jgi:hypothetical protein
MIFDVILEVSQFHIEPAWNRNFVEGLFLSLEGDIIGTLLQHSLSFIVIPNNSVSFQIIPVRSQ